MELTQLQQELAEDAPLLAESQLLDAQEEHIPSTPGTVSAPALTVLVQRSQPNESQRANLPKAADDVDAAASGVEVSNKRAKHMPIEMVPTTTAAAVGEATTQSDPVAAGKKKTKKRRKL